jgi:hypothetical protein
LLGRLDQLWLRVPGYKPLSVGVVLLGLVPASEHQPDLFAADNRGRQKLSPLVDRINDRYGRCIKLPALRHVLERGVAFERLHLRRQQAEADRVRSDASPRLSLLAPASLPSPNPSDIRHL